MAKRTKDSSFDDGRVSRAQDRSYSEGLLRMAEPKSKFPQFMAKLVVWGFLSALFVMVVLNLVLAANNGMLNSSLSKTLETQYNPSFRVRYSGVGAEVINAWYSKKSPPINVSSDVQWTSTSPGSLSAAAANNTNNGSTRRTGTGTTGSGSSSSTGSSSGTGADTSKTAAITVTGISFLSGSQVHVQSATANADRYEERLQYYALVNDVPYIIGVTIAIPNLDDTNALPTLVSAPTVISRASVSTISNDPDANPVAKYGQAKLSDQTTSVLGSWAKAWAEDDSPALKSATQDSNTDNVYRGLGGGWSFVPKSLSVKWSAVSPSGGGYALARVSFQIQTPSTVVPATTGQNAQAAQTIPGAVQTETMDVMIGKYDTGSPSVVAWGQAGTYPDLKPFGNALTKEASAKLAPSVNVTAPAQQGVVPNPTPTAGQ